MEKSKGRVRNIIVNDLNSLKEMLIRCLIRHGIEYVNIDNEFHFMDRIYRFYDVKSLSDLIDKGIVILGREDDIVRVFSEESLMFIREKADLEKTFLDLEPVDDRTYEFKSKNDSIPKYNKSMIKRQNHMLNQRLKNNKR